MPIFCEESQPDLESEASNPGTGMRMNRHLLLLNVFLFNLSTKSLMRSNKEVNNKGDLYYVTEN